VKHTEGTLSKSAHFLGTQNFVRERWMHPRSLTIVKILGSPKCALILNVPSVRFTKWPDDDYESKHVATFMIDNKLVVFLTEPNLRISSENTSGWF